MTADGGRRSVKWLRWCFSWLLLTQSVALFGGEADLAHPSSVVEYLYIDANEAQASGGHAAVRIDEDVFHFQFASGLLALARDDWADFQLSYRGYQNRNIHASRLALTPETSRLLRRAFVRRYLTQSAQLQRVADARADHRLLASLVDPAEAEWPLPGFGFFLAPELLSADSQPAPLATLRATVTQVYGDGFLGQKHRDLSAELSALNVQPVVVRAEDFQPGTLPRPDYAFNQRYADLLAAIRGLDVLSAGWTLDPERLSLAALATEDFELGARDADLLEQAMPQLEQRLLHLLDSQRPDWGSAFLLGLMRLETMRLSRQSGRWIFFDVLHGESDLIPVGGSIKDNLDGLQGDARQLWLQTLEEWRNKPGWDERLFANLETRAVNNWELQRVAAGADHWRVRDKQGIARGRGFMARPPKPDIVVTHGSELEQEMHDAMVVAEQYAAENLGYQLLERNCVSELFATVDQAMADAVKATGGATDKDTLQQEAIDRLGGVFDPSPVPFYSSRQVRKHWRVEDYQELSSLRRLYTAKRYREESSLGVLLKESNTLTSSVYRRSDDDSFFIFFTDGNAAVRPALGLVNLTSALGRSVVGVLQAPFDAGHGLSAGLRGALFSLPELGFQNIRKGTSTWLVPELRAPQ